MDSQGVALQAETTDKAGAMGRDDRALAVQFPSEEVGDVDFYNRSANGSDRIG